MIGSKARGRFDYASPPKKWEGEHDLTDPRSLVCIAGELRERERARQEARRRAWEARQRRSWLRRAAGWLGDILRRGDRAPAGRTAALPPAPNPQKCQDCGGDVPNLCDACLAEGMGIGAHGLLTDARIAALREQRPGLAAAIHSVLLLDMTGNLDDMAALVCAVQEAYKSALGDDPGAVN